MKSSPWIWQLLHTVKLMLKILSIFVAFSENVNFIITYFPIVAQIWLSNETAARE